MVLPNGNLLGASDQGPHSVCIRGNPQGVAERPPDYQEFGIRREMIIETPLASKIIKRWESQLGKPFDGSALHSFLNDKVFDRNWQDPNMWFCSEGIVWSMEMEGFWDFPILWAKSRISPMDLYLILAVDHRFVNRLTFWDQIQGLKLGPREL